MEQKYLEYCQCTACGETLTDEAAFFDVEADDAPYCAECYYEYPYGPFFGEYDKNYDKHNPTEKQQFCISCHEYVGPMRGFSEDTWYENRCPKCGRHYKSKGTVVMECRTDGTLIPFMRVSKWGRWQLDNAEPDTAVDTAKPRR